MIIIPGQSGTYRHLQHRVIDLIAESGLSGAERPVLALSLPRCRSARACIACSVSGSGGPRRPPACHSAPYSRAGTGCCRAAADPRQSCTVGRKPLIVAGMLVRRSPLLRRTGAELFAVEHEVPRRIVVHICEGHVVLEERIPSRGKTHAAAETTTSFGRKHSEEQSAGLVGAPLADVTAMRGTPCAFAPGVAGNTAPLGWTG